MIGKKPHYGNSLVEYTLPLVILIGSAGLMAAVEDFPQAIQDFLHNGLNADISNNSLHVKALGNLPAMKTLSANALSTQMQKGSSLLLPPSAHEQQICFKSGICLNISTDNQNLVDTTGGLGGSQLYATSKILNDLAAQLQAAGADPSLVQLVSKLANSGHSLGDYAANESQMLAQAQTLCAGKTVCKSSDLPADQFWDYNFGTPDTELSQLNANWLTLQAYIQNNPKAFANFPEAKGIIGLEYQNILNLSNGIGSAANWDQSSPMITDSGNSTTFGTQANNYATSSGGQSVGATSYTDSNGQVIYQVITTGNTQQAYALQDGQFVPTTDPPPSDSQTPWDWSYHSVYILDTGIKNSVTIHQDANTICSAGGNLSSCYLVAPAATSSNTSPSQSTAVSVTAAT